LHWHYGSWSRCFTAPDGLDRTTTTADATFTGVTPINLVARSVSIGEPCGPGPDLRLGGPSRLHGAGLLIAVYVGFRLLSGPLETGSSAGLGLTLLVLALLGHRVVRYVTWGVIVVCPGRHRTPSDGVDRDQHVLGLCRHDDGPRHLHAAPAHFCIDRPAPDRHTARGGHHADRPVHRRATRAPAPPDAGVLTRQQPGPSAAI